jgi:uncharacterized protein YndB with AHSA1/START domain
LEAAVPGNNSTTEHSTFTLERTFAHPASRVYALFSTPEKKRRWLLEDSGTTIGRFDMDFRVGGHEVGEYTIRKGSPVDGMPFVNDSIFLDIVPDRRVVLGQTMSIGGRRISIALIMFELTACHDGTRLTLTHQGIFFEGSGGAELRTRGWEALMQRIVASADEKHA